MSALLIIGLAVAFVCAWFRETSKARRNETKPPNDPDFDPGELAEKILHPPRLSKAELRSRTDAVARLFYEKWGEYLVHPGAVRDRCILFSDVFRKRLQLAGVPADLIAGYAMASNLRMKGHTAVLVGSDLVYDWTARQFDPSAPVPLIQTLEEWREQWKDVSAGRPANVGASASRA